MYWFVRDKRVRPVPTGRVKWYDAEKGFGFLSQEDGEDVYVRSSALPAGVEGLKAGQRVEFTGDGPHHLGDSPSDLAIRVATLA